MSIRPAEYSPDELREAFRHYLRSHRIKVTNARLEVLDTILGLQGHFQADQVADLLKEEGRSVGKATVYRTLPLLVDCGILKRVLLDLKRAHFELAFGEQPHDHMVCRRCGRIVEFASDEVLELRNRIAKSHHFHVTAHRFQLSGLCWECSVACPVAEIPR